MIGKNLRRIREGKGLTAKESWCKHYCQNPGEDNESLRYNMEGINYGL